MALDFGKLEFSVSFNPTSAFPLDARSYFESLESAKIAAASATQAGKADSAYYYGQNIAVVENGIATMYIIQPNNTLQAVGKIDSNLFVFDEFGNLTLKDYQDAAIGAVPKKSVTGLKWEVPVDSYSKEEIDSKISKAVAAAPHLKRKIVNSVGEIKINAADADQYIYMVPTGLQEDSNKYMEYIVIILTDNDNTETRFIEQVGSWDVNLENYATKDELNEKVDKVADHTLIPVNELNKLLNIPASAETNVINSVSPEFTINEELNRRLEINSVDATKVTGLELLLAAKVDKKEGYTLLSPSDQKKLDALVIENGNLEISGSVNASNVKDLAEWLTEHSSGENYVPGLSEHNLTDDLYNKLVNTVLIKKVNPSEFKITEDKELTVLNIDASKVTGLIDALNEKASETSVNNLANTVYGIEAKLNDYVLKSKHDSDLEAIWDVLTWKNINE